MSKKNSYFKHEIVSKLFSSKKRWIKFIAICFVPFLYGFICVAAFWDPVSNIGKVPMAIVDNSSRIDLVIANSKDSDPITQKKKIIIGVPNLNDIDPVTKYPNSILKSDGSSIPISKVLVYKKNYSFIEDFINGWANTPIKDSIISKNPDGTYTIQISNSNHLENVSYFNNYNTSKKANEIANYNPQMINPITKQPGAWEVKDENYWLQIQIPTSFNQIFAYTLTSMYTTNPIPEPSPTLITNTEQSPEGQNWVDELSKLKETPINIWTTFKKNFLFGQFMKVFIELKSAMVVEFYPRLITETIINIINDFAHNIYDGFFFSPTQDIVIDNLSANFHIGTIQNSKDPQPHTYNNLVFKANEKYLIRNDEIKKSISNKLNQEVSVSQEDKTRLNAVGTFEGNTTTLIEKQNDWSYSTNLSFLDLIQSLITPIIDNLFPSVPTEEIPASTKDISSIFKNYIKTYVKNKMFIASVLERNAELMPKKPIVPGIDKILINALLSVLPNDFPVIFSDNPNLVSPGSGINTYDKAFVTQSEWNKYVDQVIIKIKELVNSAFPKNYDANAPPIFANPLDGIITDGVIGNENSVYGIGLGQFFVFISIWVGLLMLTFVLDRKRRGPATRPFDSFYNNKHKKVTLWTRIKESLKWFYSKFAVSSIIMVIQVSILWLTIGLFGWFSIGHAYWFVYLQLLFSGLVFLFFIQALWYFFRDEVIGKFIVIIFLIINLSSGWGTFPPQMQFKFFEVLSYIAPFTYQLKNMCAIIFGVGVVGTNPMDTAFILQNVGISLIYLLIGVVLSIFGSLRLTKMQFYGTCNGRKLAQLFELKKQDEMNALINVVSSQEQAFKNDYNFKSKWDEYIITKKSIFNKQYKTVDWNKLPQGYWKEICDEFNEKFPYEVKFKWFNKKYPKGEEAIEDAKI